MRKTGLLVAIAAILLSAVAPLLAHHAFSAEFDQSKPIKLSGEITKLQWVNPHAWIFIDVKGADGKVVPWRFEMGAPNALLRAGWSKSDIKAGTAVTISGFMARSGGSVGNAFQVRLPDGRDLFAGSSLKDTPEAK
jgi:sarcosine oxidase gamma subunit